jgi:hypothetical protein
MVVPLGGYSVALNWWKLFTVQQDIDEVRPSYAETEAPVKADADPACTVCGGKGWHHGWDGITRKRVMLRCSCAGFITD